MKPDSPGPRKPALVQDAAFRIPDPRDKWAGRAVCCPLPNRAAAFPGLQLLQKQLTLGSSFRPSPPLSGNTERFANSSDYNCEKGTGRPGGSEDKRKEWEGRKEGGGGRKNE